MNFFEQELRKIVFLYVSFFRDPVQEQAEANGPQWEQSM